MRAFQIWNDLSVNLNHEILESAYLNNKKLYRSLVDEMAKNLHQRSQKLLDTPRAERHIAFKGILLLPNFDVLTQNLLMSWLLHSESALMAAFLDELKIPHDGRGCVEELPEKVDDKLFSSAVAALYKKFDQEKVTVYLKTFDSVGGRNWPIEKLMK